MNTYAKFYKEVEIEPGIFEVTYQIFDSGSCQCFKDCDCAKNKGKLIGAHTRYRNTKVLNWNDKPRQYSTLKGCKDSLEAWYRKST